MDYSAINIYKKWRKEREKKNIRDFIKTYTKEKLILLTIFIISGLDTLIFSALNIFKPTDNIILQCVLYIAFIIYIISFMGLYIFFKPNQKDRAERAKQDKRKLQQKLDELGYKTKNNLKQLCNRLNEKYKKESAEIHRMQKIIDNIFFAIIIPIVVAVLKCFTDTNFSLANIIYVAFSASVLAISIYVSVLIIFKLCKVFISDVNTIEEMIEDIHYILDHFFTVDDSDV